MDAGIKFGQLRVHFIRAFVTEQFGNFAVQLFDLQIKFIGLFAQNLEAIRVLCAVGLGEFREFLFGLL